MHVEVKWLRDGGVWFLRTVASNRIIADVHRERPGWMWYVSGLSGKSDTLSEAKTTCEIECGVTR